MRNFVLALLTLTLALPVFATDGVLEINQTCAVQTGCFSGDTVGFPVTITTPGSYRLTSNLSRTIPAIGSAGNVSFIMTEADDVTLDLGGFQISCITLLGGACTGFGAGVFGVFSPSISGTSVKNGTIRGMPSQGVYLDDRGEVKSLRAQSNGSTGIQVGNGSTVSGNIVSENRVHGIIAHDSDVQGNTVYNNGTSGSGYGIRFPGVPGAYHDNHITSPVTATRGTVSGPSVDAGGNVCNGSLTCP